MTDDPLSLRALPALEPELERHDLWQILDKLQMDLRAASAKLTEARTIIAALDLPDQAYLDCPRCGMRTTGPRGLAEHLYQLHGGDEPAHWQAPSALLKDSDA